MGGRDSVFEAAWGDHGAMVARIAGTYEADPEKARELTQDIALAFWQALPAWRGEGSLKAFAARIAHNRAVSHVIKAKGEPRATILDETLASTAPLPEAVLVANDERERLLAAVRSLPVGHAQVVSLLLEGFSHEEIATVLGLTTTNVGVRASRARSMLRVMLRREK